MYHLIIGMNILIFFCCWFYFIFFCCWFYVFLVNFSYEYVGSRVIINFLYFCWFYIFLVILIMNTLISGLFHNLCVVMYKTSKCRHTRSVHNLHHKMHSWEWIKDLYWMTSYSYRQTIGRGKYLGEIKGTTDP